MTDREAGGRVDAIVSRLTDMMADGREQLDGYVTPADVYWLAGEVRKWRTFGDVIPHTEAAELLGIKPSSVRERMRRNGIPEVRGYPRELVTGLQRRRPGRVPRDRSENAS